MYIHNGLATCIGRVYIIVRSFVAALVSCLLWNSYSQDKRISADFAALISYMDYLLIG